MNEPCPVLCLVRSIEKRLSFLGGHSKILHEHKVFHGVHAKTHAISRKILYGFEMKCGLNPYGPLVGLVYSEKNRYISPNSAYNGLRTILLLLAPPLCLRRCGAIHCCSAEDELVGIWLTTITMWSASSTLSARQQAPP